MNAATLSALAARHRELGAEIAAAQAAVQAAQVTLDAAEQHAVDMELDGAGDRRGADAATSEATVALRQAGRRHTALVRARDAARVELQAGLVTAQAAASDALHATMGVLNEKFERAAAKLHEQVRAAAAVALAHNHAAGAYLVRLQVPRSLLDPRDVMVIGPSTDPLVPPKEAGQLVELGTAIRHAEAVLRGPETIAL